MGKRKINIRIEVDAEKLYQFLTIAGQDVTGHWDDELWLAEQLVDAIRPQIWGKGKELIDMAVRDATAEELYAV